MYGLEEQITMRSIRADLQTDDRYGYSGDP